MGTRSKMSKTIIFQIFTPPHGVKGDITTCHAIRIIKKAIPGTANSTIPTGKVRRNRSSSGGFKLQRDAKEWERNFLEQFATSPDITFQSLYDKYKRFKENRVKASTLETQCNAIDLHILPYFKDRIVSDITPEDVAEWQTQLLGKKFSASHTRQLNAYLRMLFKYAVDYLRLPRSPVIAQICKPQKGNIDFWTPEEYRKFSEHIKDNIELHTAFEILFYTGMRKGELLALTMNDIDFQAKKIRINKTLAYVHGEYIMQPPKTEQSNR